MHLECKSWKKAFKFKNYKTLKPGSDTSKLYLIPKVTLPLMRISTNLLDHKIISSKDGKF